MTGIKEWWRSRSAWIAIIMFGAGCVGYGFCIATIRDQSARALEISISQAAFQSALDSKDEIIATKDKLIGALASTTVVATKQAASAVATAAIATNDAAIDTKAAAVATRKAEQTKGKTAGSAKAKEWTK